MAVICRDKKLLFLLNPRTGSSALGEHLIKEFGGEWLPKETYYDETLNKVLNFKHNYLGDLLAAGLINENEVADYVIFTSVANPYKSLKTLYNKYRYRYDDWRKEGRDFLQSERVKMQIRYCKNHSINQWIIKNYWKSAIKSFLNIEKFSINENYLNGTQYILKNESMQDDFIKMLEKFKIEGNPTIPIINKTEKGKVLNYSMLSKFLIYFTFKDDFKDFNYTF